MQRIIFLHLPKTAGTSIKRMLFSAHDRQDIFPAELVPDQSLYAIRQLAAYKVFHGHLDWSALDCLEGDRFVFTVLRSPRERIISNYYFWKGLADQSSEAELLAQHLPHLADLKRYESMSAYFGTTEVRVRQIVNYTFNNMYAYYFALRRFGWCYLGGNLPDDRVLDTALGNLETLSFVGITEQMQATVSGLATALGLPPVTTIAHDRPTALLTLKRDEIHAEIRADRRLDAQIQEFTRLDDVIYEKMRRRFDEIYCPKTGNT